MPHPLVSLSGHLADLAKGAIPRRFAPPVASLARWTPERARKWGEEAGWLVGCNFVPSTASNPLEMWQQTTFDPETIDRELGWAAELGMNSIRIFLHDLLWSADGPAFLDRIEQVLEIAAGHGISAMPVLFDGVWHPEPRLGPQPEPKPGVHNSTWVQSPGVAVLSDPRRWSSLRPYVDAVLTRFGNDPRVAVWDLFNEPDNRNAISWPRKEMRRKTPAATGLLDAVFDWCQTVDPTQPLTAGVYMGVSGSVERASSINRTLLARSDILTFHCYGNAARLMATIDHLGRYERPLLCTEWLARSANSTVDLIALFSERNVGAYCWGLVDGRSQTKYPWSTWIRPGKPDDPWFHDLLHADGTPYSLDEAALFRRVTKTDRRT